VPDGEDRRKFHLESPDATFKVRVDFDKNQTFSWTSLAHLWSDWYRRYLVADYPRLIVRFEDMLLHGPEVMKIIANCTGAQVPEKFFHQTKSAKGHGSHTDFLKAIFKTANPDLRISQLTEADLDYAATHLDKDLMRIFQYKVPTEVAKATATS